MKEVRQVMDVKELLPVLLDSDNFLMVLPVLAIFGRISEKPSEVSFSYGLTYILDIPDSRGSRERKLCGYSEPRVINIERLARQLFSKARRCVLYVILYERKEGKNRQTQAYENRWHQMKRY